MHRVRAVVLCAAIAALGFVALPARAEPATPTFTYQGKLEEGGLAANGAYDVRFTLFDAETDGSQLGSEFSASNVSVSNGLFAVPMTFGSQTLGYFNGRRLWVQAEVRPSGDGEYTLLTPRQELTATPYALGVVAPLIMNSSETAVINAYGTGTYGIIASGPTAIQGNANASGGVGVVGSAADLGGEGVHGVTYASGLQARGVYGVASGVGGVGVFGESDFGTTAIGVWGTSIQGYGVEASGRTAVKGDATGGGSDYGGQFTSSGVNSNGVRGECSNGVSSYGVWGVSTVGYAGYFSGKVAVTGSLSKASGTFKIDHPLDPAHKYLEHSFVESPDMMNIYNGNVTTDARGYATVTLPDWFTALNRDYRYQLTVIDESDSPEFVQAKVVRGVPDKSPVGVPATFTLRTSRPGVTVSWQITGVRQDAWANAHRVQVEEPKTGVEAGRYLHPELFGQAPDMSIEAGKAAGVAGK